MNSLSNVARFCNLLVHRYGTVDEERIWLILQDNLGDFELFIKKIEVYLESSNNK